MKGSVRVGLRGEAIEVRYDYDGKLEILEATTDSGEDAMGLITPDEWVDVYQACFEHFAVMSQRREEHRRCVAA